VENRNCLSYWYPRLRAAGLPLPATMIVRTEVPLIELCDGQAPDGFDAFLQALHAAADGLGGYPVFLRTGQGSGKHDWKRTCFVQAAEELPAHVAALVEWSESVDFLGLPWNVWAVRQFLRLPAPFTAFGGMPVAPEWRFFVRDGQVVCRHFYWPADSIQHWRGEPELPANWQAMLEDMQQVRAADAALLQRIAERAGAALGGAWSIDLCRDRDGTYWLTDCAEAARSFHWPGCPQAASFQEGQP